MSARADRLYELLPAVYRERDAERGWPLRALLRVIAEQVNVVEDDVARLYENWFIETCDDWVVPYIGDLVGYRPVHAAGEPGEQSTEAETARNKILIPRREVANTVRYRRRKGTLALLELLARDVAGWAARAVEFCALLACSRDVRLGIPVEGPDGRVLYSPERARGRATCSLSVEPPRGGTADLRRGDALDRLDGPFDGLAHTADVRRLDSRHRRGLYNVPHVGLWVWPLEIFPVTRCPARYLDPGAEPHFTFSALGNDTPLYQRPWREDDPWTVAGAPELPIPIRRRALRDRPGDFYGPGKSFEIWVRSPEGPVLVPLPDVVAADLSAWSYVPKPGKVAVDPKLGRIAFYEAPDSGEEDEDDDLLEETDETEDAAAEEGGGETGNQRAEEAVWVSYHHAFSAEMGGGEYRRTLAPVPGKQLFRVGRDATLGEALKKALGKKSAVVEITDSGVYTEKIHLRLKPGQSLELRAADGARPVLRLLDVDTSRLDALKVAVRSPRRRGGKPPGAEMRTSLILDGLLIAGRGVEAHGPLTDLTLRHVTLLPGWSPGTERSRTAPRPSLVLRDTRARVEIRHSILGGILVDQDEVRTDPLDVRFADSIVDAGGDELQAVSGPDQRPAHAALTVERSTVLGSVHAHAMELAENSLFTGPLWAVRTGRGCMRFCWVEPGAPPAPSRTPRRHHCQPDLAEQQAVDEAKRAAAKEENGTVPAELSRAEEERLRQRARLRVRPRFESPRYGRPDYARLARHCAVEIRRGADDESEMGAFHNLFQPQREAILSARLEEYTPADAVAGILFAPQGKRPGGEP